MDASVARKRPAEVVQTGRVPDLPRLPRTEVLQVPLHERQILMAEIHKMARRGEIGPTYRERHTERGWAVQVVRLREPGRRWHKPVLITLGVLVGLGGALWAVALAVQALAAALVALLPALLAVGAVVAVVAVLSALSGGGGTTITQIVKIK